MLSLSHAYRGARNLACLSLLVLAIVYLAPRYLNNAAALGWQFRQPDMASDYVKGTFWGLALGCTILFWPVSVAHKKLLLQGWLAKLVVCLGAMLFYESRYGGDAGMYLMESRTGDFSFADVHITGGTENLINLARLHRMLFPDSFHSMKLSFAMLGLIGIYFFYRAAVVFFGREDRRIFYLLAFFPGILFWSSILGKDPLVFLGISVYCYGVVGFKVRRQLRFLAVLALGVLIATFIRQWLAVIMMIPFSAMMLVEIKGTLTKACISVLIGIALMLSISPLMEVFKIEAAADILSVADKTTKGYVSTAGGSTQQLDVDLSTPTGIALFLPRGAFTALFRPLPGDVLNPFGMLASLESAFLLVLLFLAIKRSSLRDLKEPLVLWGVLFLAVWSLINGIVSSANFGVAVRYKLQVLPLMLGVFFHLSRKRGAEEGSAPEGAQAPLSLPAATAAAEAE